MKQKKTSLTIGIPMYNHEKTIITTLDSILCQLDEIKNLCELEVLICDNCSTDESPRIVKEYQKKYPKIIKYHKNKTNIGGLQNLKKVYELASKDYIWVLGDDIMVKGAIKSFYGIFQFCLQQKNKQPGGVLLNYLSEVMSDIHLTKKESLQNNLPTSVKYFTYDNLTDLKQSNPLLIYHPLFLGASVVKREVLSKILQETNFTIHHPQLGIFLEIAKSKFIAFINDILVISKKPDREDTKPAEFCILANMTFHSTVQSICGDTLSKKQIQNYKNTVFHNIKNYYKKVKNPKLVIDTFKQITFFNKQLLGIIKFLSRLKMDSLAFKILLIYAKNYGSKKLKKRLLAIILITILIYLIFKL